MNEKQALPRPSRQGRRHQPVRRPASPSQASSWLLAACALGSAAAALHAGTNDATAGGGPAPTVRPATATLTAATTPGPDNAQAADAPGPAQQGGTNGAGAAVSRNTHGAPPQDLPYADNPFFALDFPASTECPSGCTKVYQFGPISDKGDPTQDGTVDHPFIVNGNTLDEFFPPAGSQLRNASGVLDPLTDPFSIIYPGSRDPALGVIIIIPKDPEDIPMSWLPQDDPGSSGSTTAPVVGDAGTPDTPVTVADNPPASPSAQDTASPGDMLAYTVPSDYGDIG